MLESKINHVSHSWSQFKLRWKTRRQPANPRPGYGFGKGWETQPAPVPLHTLTRNPHGFWNPWQSLNLDPPPQCWDSIWQWCSIDEVRIDVMIVERYVALGKFVPFSDYMGLRFWLSVTFGVSWPENDWSWHHAGDIPKANATCTNECKRNTPEGGRLYPPLSPSHVLIYTLWCKFPFGIIEMASWCFSRMGFPISYHSHISSMLSSRKWVGLLMIVRWRKGTAGVRRAFLDWNCVSPLWPWG